MLFLQDLVSISHSLLRFDGPLLIAYLLQVGLLSCVRQVKDVEGVAQQALLDLQVERTIGAEARTVIDLYQPRFQILVQHDIKSEDLKAK